MVLLESINNILGKLGKWLIKDYNPKYEEEVYEFKYYTLIIKKK